MSVWRETPTLTGRYVTLRPLHHDDRAALLEAFADLDQFTTFIPKPATIDGWYDQLDAEKAAGRALPFAVLDANGAVAGVTRFMRMSERRRRVEIGGTVYARRVRRTGLNTEAKRMLLAHAFDVLGANCVQLRTDFLNHTSRRAIERLGARLDGVLRGHLILGEHLRDTAVYSILTHEWPGVRRNFDQLMTRHGNAQA